MPNWCENDLYINGAAEKVQAVLQAVKTDDEVFSFNKILPIPEEFYGVLSGGNTGGVRSLFWKVVKNPDYDPTKPATFGSDKLNREEIDVGISEAEIAEWHKKYGAVGWYDWCIQNWGTKWDACDATVWEHPVRGLCVSFNTAWSPPFPVFKKLTEMFPDIRFEMEWFEGGGAFCGGALYNPEYCEEDEVPEIREWHGEYYGSRGG